MRTLVLLLVLSALCSCASSEGSSERVETLKAGMKESGQKVASATVRGAEVVGESVGTAYRGVSNGFAEPAHDGYGPYPSNYVSTIRKHMVRVKGVKESASFQFGKPVKAYLNKGLLAGGDVDWQGWIVDLKIERKTAFERIDVDEYVVRMNDGDVVEVLDAAYAGSLRRVSEDAPLAAPGAAAPQR